MDNLGIAVITAAIRGAQLILYNDDSDEEEHQPVAKVMGYAEEIVPMFTDRQFLFHFRITPETFEDLLQKMHNILPAHEPRKGHQPIPLEKEILIMIWCLSNLESFRSVSDRFGVTKSTCWDVLYRSSRNLLNVNRHYHLIAWPSRQRAEEIIEGFQRINGFPGIVGAIDGSHIKIIKPKDHPNSYCNRKGYHSVLLQGVCDHKKMFLDVYAGEPGSIHDQRLFQKSDLFERITNGSVEFPNDSHLIGDLAYKLSRYLLVGFKNVGGLTREQTNFNNKLSQCRVVIENAFGYLKGRFRRLKYLETVRPDLISLLVVAAAIMHNICILKGDMPEELVDNLELQEIFNEDFNEHHNDQNLDLVARNKRTYIMNILDVDRNILE